MNGEEFQHYFMKLSEQKVADKL